MRRSSAFSEAAPRTRQGFSFRTHPPERGGFTGQPRSGRSVPRPGAATSTRWSLTFSQVALDAERDRTGRPVRFRAGLDLLELLRRDGRGAAPFALATIHTDERS